MLQLRDNQNYLDKGSADCYKSHKLKILEWKRTVRKKRKENSYPPSVAEGKVLLPPWMK
jgi:hypothetical protein